MLLKPLNTSHLPRFRPLCDFSTFQGLDRQLCPALSTACVHKSDFLSDSYDAVKCLTIGVTNDDSELEWNGWKCKITVRTYWLMYVLFDPFMITVNFLVKVPWTYGTSLPFLVIQYYNSIDFTQSAYFTFVVRMLTFKTDCTCSQSRTGVMTCLMFSCVQFCVRHLQGLWSA